MTQSTDDLVKRLEKTKGHTPGPWLASDIGSGCDESLAIWRADGRSDFYLRTECVAQCIAGDDDDGPHIVAAKANATLIALAPEMKDTIERLKADLAARDKTIETLRAMLGTKIDAAHAAGRATIEAARSEVGKP